MGAFTDSVDPSALTVLDPPGYIFLCGGPLDDLDHSLRARFYELRAKANPDLLKRIQLAESADLWYQSRTLFDDLLELEEHLASLSACLLLFVESPGAIAELGAFSQMPLLQEKLLIVVEQSHFKKSSFIRNGPLQQMLRRRHDSLLPYPWLSAPVGTSPRIIDAAILDDTLDEIVKAVQTALATKPRTASFDPKDRGHIMLLVADLVKLNVVSLQTELLEMLRGLGIAVERQSLAKYLYLLEQLGLISAEPYGPNAVYYVSPTSEPDHIRYATKAPAGPADRSRLRKLLRTDFPSNEQKEKAFVAFQRRGGRTTP